MKQPMTPHVVFYGPRRPESVLVAMENFISWEALRLSWNASGENDSYFWQDLEQEAMLFVHRLLLRDPDIWMRKLERTSSSTSPGTTGRMCIPLMRGHGGMREKPERSLCFSDILRSSW